MFDRSSAAPTYAASSSSSASAAEPAEAVVRRELATAVESAEIIRETLAEVATHHEAGDVQGWFGAQGRLKFRMMIVEGAIQRVQRAATSPADLAQLAQAVAVLAAQRLAAERFKHAPTAKTSIAPVASRSIFLSLDEAPAPTPPAPEVQRADDTLARAFETPSADSIDMPLASAIAQLDASGRRSLAQRLQRYRPGSGDALAAQFHRLDRARQQQILHVLDATAIATRVPTQEEEHQRVSRTNPGLLMINDEAPGYFAVHREAFTAAIHERLLAAKLELGAPQLAWQDYARFVGELARVSYLPAPQQLPHLVHPADPWVVIDQHRSMDVGEGARKTGAMTWVPAAGLAIGVAFERAVIAALPRVARRYAAELAQPGPVDPSRIVASAPIDRLLALALGARDTVARTGSPLAVEASREHRAIARIEWLGERDQTLWNWVRVTPRDATADEVALGLWSDAGYAHRLTLTSGLVQIDKELARTLPKAKRHEPASHGFDLPGQHGADSAEAVLADSVLADEIALEQAPQASPTMVVDRRVRVPETLT